jgi:hypothetical protein
MSKNIVDKYGIYKTIIMKNYFMFKATKKQIR